MENLNAEMIKKGLECCSKDDCDNCPNSFGNCYANLAEHALALITSQEQRIKELTEGNERLRERNITLEQKLMLLGCDEQYFFKPKVKGESDNVR